VLLCMHCCNQLWKVLMLATDKRRMQVVACLSDDDPKCMPPHEPVPSLTDKWIQERFKQTEMMWSIKRFNIHVGKI
jgi:hypothetical protein